MFSVILLLLFYFFFVGAACGVSYYIRLFSSKDVFTKAELLALWPYFLRIASGVSARYSIASFAGNMLLVSFFAVILTMITDFFVFQSIAVPAALTLASPLLAAKIGKESENPAEKFFISAANFVVRFEIFIPLAYLSGYAAAISFMRASDRVSFIFYSANSVVAFALMVYCFLVIAGRDGGKRI